MQPTPAAEAAATAAASSLPLFWCGAALVVLFMAWRGWQLGLIRQLLNLGFLLVAWAAGYFLNFSAVMLLRPTGIPEPVLPVISGIIIGFAVYLCCSLGASILFKKKSDQKFSFLRFILGISGAFLGALFGLMIVASIVFGLRLYAALPEGAFGATSGLGNPAVAAEGYGPLLELKKQIDEGWAGGIVQKLDPVPETWHSTLNKIGQLSKSADASTRFLALPEIRAVTSLPSIAKMLNNRVLGEKMAKGDMMGVFTDPDVIQAANDPAVRAQVEQLDLEALLDRALRQHEKTRRY